MKLGQLIDYNKRKIFPYAENEAERIVPDVVLFFKYA